MKLIETIFVWVAANFTTEVYMISTKIQGILWSIADIVLVFVFLKIADLVRVRTQKKKIRWRYFSLWFSAVLTPILIFTQTPKQVILLESVICGTQFSILIYTVIVERKGMMDFITKEIYTSKGHK